MDKYIIIRHWAGVIYEVRIILTMRLRGGFPIHRAPAKGFRGPLCFFREDDPFFSPENPVKIYSK